jgi:predicted MPP superfamily phosphohydrolase
MDEQTFNDLRQRLGDEHLGKRMRAQVEHIINVTGQGLGTFHYENIPLFIRMVALSLRISGLIKYGERNALQFTVRQNCISFPRLPKSFDGLRILQLSDLHLDGHPGLGRLIAQAVDGLSFDLCVLTGDFRFSDVGHYRHLVDELDVLIPSLKCPLGVYGVLGNHDFIEMAPLIEAAGVQLLLNEGVELDAKGGKLWLIGLEDAHYYGLHNFGKALQGVPEDTAKILLVHSPELISQAAALGFGLYLTGHTHAGQMCLPGGFPLLLNARCPRRYIAGGWQYNGMNGYTSAGIGSSGVFARFFCPPEITIHTLKSAVS